MDREQALTILQAETPRYIFRRFNLNRMIRPVETFIEIGAGNMRYTHELAARARRGVAVEYGEQASQLYKQLKATHFQNVTLISKKFEDAVLNETFDLVIACEVMEHVEDDRTFFANMLRLVNPGGQLVFSVPSRMRYWSTSDEIVGHYRRYEKADVAQLLGEQGITTYEIVSYGFPFTNLFRLLREAKAKQEQAEKAKLSMSEQSALSGFPDIPGHYRWSRYVVNRKTMYPFAWISTCFNHLDWAEGYIVAIPT